jgi:hypothetical protein
MGMCPARLHGFLLRSEPLSAGKYRIMLRMKSVFNTAVSGRAQSDCGKERLLLHVRHVAALGRGGPVAPQWPTS